MGEKSKRKGAFQENILELLQKNLHEDEGLTCNEIAEKLDRSVGSTSGTLSALSQKGWIIKSDNYPAKYLYNNNYNNYNISTSSSNSSDNPSEKKLDDSIKQSDNSIDQNTTMVHEQKQNLNLNQVVTKLKQKIEILDREIEERTECRAKFITALEVLEKKI